MNMNWMPPLLDHFRSLRCLIFSIQLHCWLFCFLFFVLIFIIVIFKLIWHLVSFLFIHDSLMWYLIFGTVFGFKIGENFKIQMIEKLPNHFSQTLYIMFRILQFHINLITFFNVPAVYVLAYVLYLYINEWNAFLFVSI